MTDRVSTLQGIRCYFLRPRLPTTKVKSFSHIEAKSQCVASDSTFFFFVCSHGIRQTLQWLHFIPPTHRLLLTVQACQKASPPLRQKRLSQHSFTFIHEKTLLDVSSHKKTPADWKKLEIDWKAQSQTGEPVVVFFFSSYILDVKSLPHLKASSKRNLSRCPPCFTYTNDECQRKHPQEQAHWTNPHLYIFFKYISPFTGVVTNPVTMKNKIWGEYCATLLGLQEQLPRNVIGFLVSLSLFVAGPNLRTAGVRRKW